MKKQGFYSKEKIQYQLIVNFSRLMSKEDQLKQACQYIMNAFIENGSFQQNHMIDQKEQSEYVVRNLIMINLDEQSQSFGLFEFERGIRQHWIDIILDHLNRPKPSIGNFYRQSTSAQQMIEQLLEEDDDPYQHTHTSQQIINLSDIKLRQIALYSKTPKHALLFMSIRAINKDLHMLVVRNFHGQILHISISFSYEQKYAIIFQFCLTFLSPFLILFDSIDVNTHGYFHQLKQKLTALSQRVPLVYFKIKSTGSQFNAFKTQPSCFDEVINSLYPTQYNNTRGLCLSQSQKIKFQQGLIQHYQSLQQDETKIKLNISRPKAFLKHILQVNYQRDKFYRHNLTKNKNFQDFIKTKFQSILESCMNSYKRSLSHIHTKKPQTKSEACRACQLEGKLNSQAFSICQGCSKQNDNVFFCDKCFDNHLVQSKILQGSSYLKPYQSVALKSQDSNSHKADSNGKGKTCLAKTKNNQKTAKNSYQKQIQLLKTQQSKLSPEQQKNLQQMTKLTKKYLASIGKIKNIHTYYMSQHQEASSEKLYSEELKNQVEFIKFMNESLAKELKGFQNGVYQIIFDQAERKKSKNSQQKENSYKMDIQNQVQGKPSKHQNQFLIEK